MPTHAHRRGRGRRQCMRPSRSCGRRCGRGSSARRCAQTTTCWRLRLDVAQCFPESSSASLDSDARRLRSPSAAFCSWTKAVMTTFWNDADESAASSQERNTVKALGPATPLMPALLSSRRATSLSLPHRVPHAVALLRPAVLAMHWHRRTTSTHPVVTLLRPSFSVLDAASPIPTASALPWCVTTKRAGGGSNISRWC